MDVELTLEQCFQLKQLSLELKEMKREELMCMVISEREELLLQQRYFKFVLESAGIAVEEESDISLALPETEEEMLHIFGHIPSEEELCYYVAERVEAHQLAARIDVDIEAIALGLED